MVKRKDSFLSQLLISSLSLILGVHDPGSEIRRLDTRVPIGKFQDDRQVALCPLDKEYSS